jgi:hypothetical protein
MAMIMWSKHKGAPTITGCKLSHLRDPGHQVGIRRGVDRRRGPRWEKSLKMRCHIYKFTASALISN